MSIMSGSSRRTFTTALLALTLLLSAGAQGHGTQHTADHRDGHPLAVTGAHDPAQPGKYTRTAVDYRIPDLALVAADGSATSMRAELDTGKPVMLNFIFTSCTATCPVTSAIFAQVRDQLEQAGHAFRMISISIDPEHDTPERLSSYARRYHAGPEWHFLTGDIQNTLLLQQAFDAYRGGKMSHVPVTFLRGPRGTSWTRLEGDASAADLLREYRSLATQ